MSDHQQIPIAVVGMSALMPRSDGIDEFWANIVQGRDLTSDVPESHWLIDDYYDTDPSQPDKTYCRRGAFLPEVSFDPIAHGVPPNIMEATDPAQLLGLIVADRLLADVRRNVSGPLDRERTGVILGSGGLGLMGTMDARLQRPVWLKALREARVPETHALEICDRISAHYVPWQEATFPGLLSNVVAGRIANRLDLHGTNCTIDAACAGSLAAVYASVNELALGHSDLMFTGGVDALNSPFMFICFSKTPALSATGDCRPFSADADGTLLGEGLGMVALKRLSDAERDGDAIYAVIRGIGSSSDGRGNAIYTPVPQGQARALRRAYAAAGYGPETVELVEAHGTGTRVGDATEFAALREVFTESAPGSRGWCALGSIKSQIGHTKSAAGAAGLIKTILALRHKVLPPSIKADRPNPALQIESSPFYLSTAAKPWVHNTERPRRAALSSFGFGGSNFHATLEEYIPDRGGRCAPPSRTLSHELVLVDADNIDELVSRCSELTREESLRELAQASQQAFDPARRHRLAVVASDIADLRDGLHRALTVVRAQPNRCFDAGAVSYACGTGTTGPIAFVFPGQGAQYPGMGAEIAMSFPAAQAVWDRTAALTLGDQPLHDLVFPPPPADEAAGSAQQTALTDTQWAQPALAAHSMALLAVLAEVGISATCFAGHSVGELIALYAAGALTERELLRLTRRRGELMAAVPVPGAMLAVSTDAGRARDLIDGAGVAEVWPANLNTPVQTVISGTEPAIATMEKVFEAADVTTRRLKVSAAFHCPLVGPAAKPLRKFLDNINIVPPTVDVYGNSNGHLYPRQPSAIKDRIAEQLTSPVHFVDQIEAMYEAGIRVFLEVGAGDAVTAMVSAILGERSHLAVSLDRRGQDGVASLFAALGRLATSGLPVDFAAHWAPYLAREDDAPKKSAMSLAVNGAAFGHRYPPADGALPPPNPETTISESPTPEPAPKQKATEHMDDPQQPRRDDTAGSNGTPWFQIVADAQRQTAEAHTSFQQALVTSHQAFLQLAESSIAHLAAIVSAGPASAPVLPPQQPNPASSTAPAQPYSAAPAITQVPAAVSNGAASAAPPTAPPDLPAALASTPYTKSPAPAPVPTNGKTPAPEINSGASPSLELLREILADKTGYPAELLGGDMDLESELGVDSIKKVELLAAVRSRAPGLPPSDSPEMAELFRLRTLNAIVDHISATNARARAAAPAVAHTTADGGEASGSPPNTLRRFALRSITAPPCGLTLAGLGDAPVLVVDGGSGLASAVATALTERGITATAAEQSPVPRSAVVLLGGLAPISGADTAHRTLLDAFHWARSVAAVMECDGGVFITVQDTGGSFGLTESDCDRAWLGGLAALTRTAAREWPKASVKAIDLARADRSPEVIAEAIATELTIGGPSLDVGLSAAGARTTVGLVEAPKSGVAAPAVTTESVLVVTGGARGVTASALHDLAKATRPRLAIFGRTPLTEELPGLSSASDKSAMIAALAARPTNDGATPAQLNAEATTILATRQVRHNLARLQATGADVRYFPVDVTDRTAVESALHRVREEWGPVTGLLHAAGVLADKRITDKTDDQFEAVMATKVEGLRVLLEALARDPLRLLCVFSSVAARFGNPGQCDYAMANDVLNHVAAANTRTRPGCVVRAIGWGPWDGGMVTPELAAHFAQRSIPLIAPALGAAALAAELTEEPADTQVVITAGDGPLTPEAELRATVRLGAPRYAPLSDHAIAGTPVLPVAMALTWFAGLASAWQPQSPTLVLRDVTVLRKVVLDADGPNLTLSGVPDGTGFTMHLADGRPTPCYRARAMKAGVFSAEPSAWTSPEDLQPLPRPHLYDGDLLFHGPRFRALTGSVLLGRSGATAEMTGVYGLGWARNQPWIVDPAAIDGLLQLAVVWAERALGAATLPMAVADFRAYRLGPCHGRLEGRLRSTDVADEQARCDAALVDSAGAMLIELLGITLVTRPDLASGKERS
ncbi:type I polyketide synthase [Nocardia sp. XZ_19_385]|uniref:type I polyketide synthase n=1 Tax=Nocardia sp. XZ_19_385 TaxID=2769488 RepID=UPI00188F12A7|nr:type I polyketide synthase [Nocardia sp. XZ_19_385]